MGRLFAEQRKLLFNTISGGAQRWLLEKRNGHSFQSPHNNFEILVSLSEDFFFLSLKKPEHFQELLCISHFYTLFIFQIARMIEFQKIFRV